MRIVNRQQFLAMPAGTVYAKYEPCSFEDLCIKGDSLPNDWFYQQIVDAIDVHDGGQFWSEPDIDLLLDAARALRAAGSA